MQKPTIRYLVASPFGDVSVDNDRLDLPLEVDTLETPYGTYFDSIKNFLASEEFKPFLDAVNKKTGREVHVKDIDEIIIRAEKHGLLYHPASIDIALKHEKVKFGLNVAVTDTGKDWLKEEFSVLQKLHKKFNLRYLPEVYFAGELNSMLFMLEEWFEGYHEFHLSKTENGDEKLKLWEFGKGYHYLSFEQSFEVYKQASKILTLYYDFKDFSQIYPWHHAAGDFIVKIEDESNPPLPPFTKGRDLESPTLKNGNLVGFSGGKIDVRLTTARQYEPYMTFQDKEDINPVIALFYFFLNLTIKMRLDKLDGVGATVWAKDFCLEATKEGFIEGLRLKDELKDYLRSEDELIHLLKSFCSEDLKTAYSPLIDLYKQTGDYPVITVNLDKHVEALHTILQNFPS